jgi:PiT family inorganic phosphate transporter
MELLLVIIILALAFDFINGFHDAANSIATVVSTKVLTPFQAVLWAAVFNFAAFFIFKDHGVANTIAKTVKADFITLQVISSGLVAAIIWNLLTWWYGIPSSSSHTLIGGFAGAAIAHGIALASPLYDAASGIGYFSFVINEGLNTVNSEPVIKTASFIILAPLVGMIVAFIISIWFLHSFKKSIFPKAVFCVGACFGGLYVVCKSGNRSRKAKVTLRPLHL